MNWDQAIEKLTAAESIFVFTHSSMDGDAMGSAIALCHVMRKLGKSCFAVTEDEIPTYLRFMETKCFVPLEKVKNETADLAIALDLSARERLGCRAELYDSCKHSLCIDHHERPEEMAELLYSDPKASASAILISELIDAMENKLSKNLMDKEIAEAVYLGLLTDTGAFKYSNTDARTHFAAAKMYSYGIDHTQICVNVYDNYPFAQLGLEALAIERAALLKDGKGVISWCKMDDISRLGADLSMADTCIDRIRSIQGVEIAAFVKEKEDGSYKVNLRAKTSGNVRDIAAVFGGGGHIKAAGCTLHCSLDEAIVLLSKEIEKALE